MDSGEFLSEDDGAHLVCDTCDQQVRSNEAHECPGPPPVSSMVEKLKDLRRAFTDLDDFNDIPQDMAVEMLDDLITRLSSSGDSHEYAVTVFLDFDTSVGVEPSTFLENMDYEFKPGQDLGNIHRTEIVAWQPR